MKIRDLLGMSLSSLWRRKVRTVLTVLGVVIGVASIVVMVSLGLGLDRASMAQIEQYGGLTTIEVSSGGGYYMYDGGDKDREVKNLDDDAVAQFRAIEHVKDVYPMLNVDVIALSGGYQSYLQVRGMTPEGLRSLNLDLTEGSHIPADTDKLEFLYGNTVITNFYKEKTNEYYWETGVLPDVNLQDGSMFVIFDQDAYWNSKWGGTDENGAPVQAPKKFMIESAGTLTGGPDDWTGMNSYLTFCNIDALKNVLKKVFKGKVIPGQPTTNSGKPYKQIYYNQINVDVDNMDYMESVQQQIRDLGYDCYSNSDWIEQTRQQSKSIQAALGGIGAVALLVAAIGIANTMMMSIYERTKEIGVMKVLGCELPYIRNLFLAEAAFIGFIGGIAGLILSYSISFIINYFTKEAYMGGLSYIPIWLAGLALIFAVFVGMLSGLLPALRAMRLSPLAAIHNE